MLLNQVNGLLLLLFPCIVTCNFTVSFPGSKSATFSFRWFLEGETNNLTSNNTVVISAQVVPNSTNSTQEIELVDIKIANTTSLHNFHEENNAHRFICESGKQIGGVPQASGGVGKCADLEQESNMQIKEVENYAVLVFEPRGQQLFTAYSSEKLMSCAMATIVLNSLIKTVEDLAGIGMFHDNIHPKNIYRQDAAPGAEHGKILLSNFVSAFYRGSTIRWFADMLYSAFARMVTQGPCVETEKESVIFCVIHLASGFLPWEKRTIEYLALTNKKYSTPEDSTVQAEKRADETKKDEIREDIKLLKCRFQFSDYAEYDAIDQELKRILMVTLLSEARGRFPSDGEIQTSIARYAEVNKNAIKLSREGSFVSNLLRGFRSKPL